MTTVFIGSNGHRAIALIATIASIASIASIAVATGCGGGEPPVTTDPISATPVVPVVPDVPVVPVGVDQPPTVLSSSATQIAVVGSPFVHDCTKGGTAFSDPRARGLTYTVTFSPAANGLTAAAGRIGGAPSAPGILVATVTAFDVKGDSASQSFSIVVFAAGLTGPNLPSALEPYSDSRVPFPAHFTVNAPGGSVIGTDNTPVNNPITDAGATLGRVLFYDPRLSANDKISCASCHQQAAGFGDTARLSRGFAGGLTGRHAPGLTNARFYERGRFFWDERAATLEAQVLQPIQNDVEMGMTLERLALKLSATNYYPALFQSAFGSTEVTSQRISRALAQFVRSLVSTQSRFDAAFSTTGAPIPGVLSPQEAEGATLFATAGCAACHATNAQVGDDVRNTGLDATTTDVGAGSGRFKTPSLRNIAVRAPYMHDGRFPTLRAVVDFYDSGVQASSNLDNRLRAPNGAPRRLNLTASQRDALVAYLNALTDPAFLTATKFADPFR